MMSELGSRQQDRQRYLLLLVEDNADDEFLTLRALQKSKVVNEVVVARDGEEALDYLFARGQYQDRPAEAMPALVLLDLRLPKITGLEVLRALRENERTSLLPVVILTSSDEERDIVESYNLGANSYIRKPVDFEQFTDAVRQLGFYWLLLNTAPPRRYSRL